MVFSSLAGPAKVCIFTIEAPKNLHVELSCDSATATANEKNAASRTPTVPPPGPPG